jgi:hypothetical protein
MKIIFLLLTFLTLRSAWTNTPVLKKFKTDYCTNFSEGTRGSPDRWKHCCLVHDLYFWAGGDKADRLHADLELKSCITQSGSPFIARLMYLGVRAGFYSPIKYSDRKWSNGWYHRLPFKKLTTEEIDLLDDEIHFSSDDFSLEVKSYFIHQLRSRLD